jgi:hypothetical protein
MKILVANPPWKRGRFSGIRSGCRFPYLTDELSAKGIPSYIPFPFSLAQATALLKKHGFEVEFWDWVADGGELEEFLRQVVAYRPDLYIQEVVAPSYPDDKLVLEALRHSLPDATLAVAGTMITGWGTEMLAQTPCIDVGLPYEWEETALDLASRLRDRHTLTGTPGLFHRQDGVVVAEPRRPRPDVNSLPWSFRDTLPMLNYNDDFAFLPVPNLQMFSSRGCPYRCSFCLWINARYGDLQVSYRDPADIIAEIQYCLGKWPFKAVYFDDDTFNIKKSHVLGIADAYARSDIKVPWAAMCRADLFDRETLQECKKSGLYAVKYGIDSATPEIIQAIGKNLDLEKAREVIAYTRELGIKVHLTMMIGLPGETHQTIKRTWKFAKQVKPDYMQFSLATPYPGTELYDQAREKGWIVSKNWSEYNADSQAAMCTDALTREELEAWARTLNVRRIGLQIINNPFDCLRMYARKAADSPRKVMNVARSILSLGTN